MLKNKNMDEELYKQNILDHYKHPHGKGVLTDFDIKKRGRNASCGDDLTLYIKFDQEHKVRDVAFEGEGCAISIAAASMLTETIKGKTVKELALISPGDIYNMLGIPISPGRVNCALLAYKALNDSIKAIE